MNSGGRKPMDESTRRGLGGPTRAKLSRSARGRLHGEQDFRNSLFPAGRQCCGAGITCRHIHRGRSGNSQRDTCRRGVCEQSGSSGADHTVVWDTIKVPL